VRFPLTSLGPVLPRAGTAVTRYGVALVGQGLLGGFQFALNIVLIRTLPASDYGVFALTLVLAYGAAGIVSALAATPLSVYLPARRWPAMRALLEALFASVSLLLALGTFVLAALVAVLLGAELPVALAVAALIASWIPRHFMRSMAFARRSSGPVLVCDASYVALGCLALALPLLLTTEDLLAPVLLMVAVANLGGTWSAAWALGLPLRPRLRFRFLRLYRRFWPVTRWSLLGVVTTTLQSEAHSFIVSAWAGPAAYAPLAAGWVLFGPVRMALDAWMMVMRPELVRAIADRDRHGALRILHMSMALLAAGTLATAGAIHFFWEPVSAFLYTGAYEGQPMRLIVTLWAGVALILALRSPASGVMQAYRAFRPLALATVVGALLSVFLVVVLLAVASPPNTPLAVLVADLLTLFILLRWTLRRLGVGRNP
jgi:O-antigen/teichoic acid export membrane protein